MANPKNEACVLEKVEGKPYLKSGWMKEDDIKLRNQLIECYHVGMGFMLIKRGVFERITPPFFMDSHFIQNDLERFGGEDVVFCYKVRKAGFQIWVDPRVRCGHAKTIVI